MIAYSNKAIVLVGKLAFASASCRNNKDGLRLVQCDRHQRVLAPRKSLRGKQGIGVAGAPHVMVGPVGAIGAPRRYLRRHGACPVRRPAMTESGSQFTRPKPI